MKIKKLTPLKKVTGSQNPITICIQNWRVKPAVLLGPVILLALIFQSCEEPIEVSGDLVPGTDNTELKFVELPLNVQQSTFDSVLVSSNNLVDAAGNLYADGRVYIGRYNDPEIGEVQASAYAGVILQSGFERSTVQSNAVLVSAKLYLNFNYFYGSEFGTAQTFKVSQLRDTLTNRRYSIYDSFETDQEISNATALEIATTDTVTTSIPLKTSFGNSVLTALSNEDLSNTELLQALRGFKIEVEGSVNNMQGLNIAPNKSYFQLVYQNPEDDTVKSVNFTLAASTNRGLTSPSFTSVNFTPGSLIPSGFSGNRAYDLTDPTKVYFNRMMGFYPKVDIQPYLDFIDTIDFMIINKAEFVIENPDLEITRTSMVQKSPPGFLVPYILNGNNVVEKVGENFWAVQANFDARGALADPAAANAPVTINLNSNNQMKGDVSFFFQEIFDRPSFWEPDYQLSLQGQFIRTNPTPFVETPVISIGNFNNFLVNKSDIKLRIYYTTFR